ncbi:ferredoxin [Kitasatospora mediocidica]|uniref:ferredoxin n=1 Tax=Kitasatospora mediocidica TaxID=58352 RepID=UPI00068F969D|nr:ferredoxin [Kitasatospora mediocidica]
MNRQNTAPALVVRVDRARCVGTGLCAGAAPADLALGEDGRARALRPATTDREGVTEAAELCPVEALAVHRVDTGEQIAPAW